MTMGAMMPRPSRLAASRTSGPGSGPMRPPSGSSRQEVGARASSRGRQQEAASAPGQESGQGGEAFLRGGLGIEPFEEDAHFAAADEVGPLVGLAGHVEIHEPGPA